VRSEVMDAGTRATPADLLDDLAHDERLEERAESLRALRQRLDVGVREVRCKPAIDGIDLWRLHETCGAAAGPRRNPPDQEEPLEERHVPLHGALGKRRRAGHIREVQESSGSFGEEAQQMR